MKNRGFNMKKYIKYFAVIVVIIVVTSIVFAAAVITASSSQSGNSANLTWNNSDAYQSYNYEVYKRVNNGTYSKLDTETGTKVQVLNLYPTTGINIGFSTYDGENLNIDKSASLKKWMEESNGSDSRGYGRGVIEVTPVSMAAFNANPSAYLYKVNGEYNYQVVVVGTWDSNSTQDLVASAASYIRTFINQGGSFISGHDTITGVVELNDNLKSLRDLANIKVGDLDGIQMGNGESYGTISIGSAVGVEVEVEITQTSQFTAYPWNIGGAGTKLKVPATHTTNQCAYGFVPIRFTNQPSIPDSNGNGEWNYYLTINNKVAMIQTGHSNCDATADEQKIWANLLFYLGDVGAKTEATDENFVDINAPNAPSVSNVLKTGQKIGMDFTAVDNGTKYDYYVKAIDAATLASTTSNTTSQTRTTGVAKYEYVINGDQTTDLDSVSTQFTTGTHIDYTIGNYKKTYLHIRAIDGAGNVGATTTILIYTNVPPTVTLTQSTTEYTNGNVVITATGADTDGTVVSITCPDGSVISGSTSNYTVTKNGTYTFTATDNCGDTGTKSITITNIDKLAPYMDYEIIQPTMEDPHAYIRYSTHDQNSTIDYAKSEVDYVIPPSYEYDLEGEEIIDNSKLSGDFEVAENTTYTFYVYDKAGNVTRVDIPVVITSLGVNVHYVRKSTDEKLLSSDKINGIIGTEYTTSRKPIADYVAIDPEPTNASGYLLTTPQDVYYYYVHISDGVDVRYVDQVTGEVLEYYTINGVEGQEYKTDTIVIPGYVLVNTPTNKDGVMTIEKTTVTYEYRRITTLRVEYVDKINETVLSTYTTIGKEGDEYETESRIIANYSLTETPSNANGVMNVIYNQDGTVVTETVVIYYYGLISKGVTIQHIDKVTGLLLEQENMSGNEGDTYITESKTFSGYRLVETPLNGTGIYGKYKEIVKYYYQRITPVVAEYINELTGEKLVPDVINNNLLEGESYTTEAKKIEGYQLVKMPDNANSITMVDETGNVTTNVRYYYREISGGLEVRYLDIADDRELLKVEIEGLVGEVVNTKAKAINGYVISQKPTEEQYTLQKEKQTAIYYYKKVSKGVEVKYIDNINGNLLDEEIVEGNEGEPYTTAPKIIDGYELVETPSNASGIMTDGVIEVTYEYRRIMKLVVKYVDINTREELDILEEKKLEGDAYKAESKIIEGYQYSRSEYEEEGIMQVEHNRATGEEITEKLVVYYYVKEAGNLVISYIDKDTEEILEKITITGYVGDEILLEEKLFTNYLLVESPKVSKIKLTVDDTEAKYYYERMEGTITVRYVDKDTGKELLEADVITDKVGTKYVTERREIQNYRAYGEDPINKDGEIAEDPSEVVYYYEKVPGRIVIVSRDADTKEILAEEIIDGYLGETIKKIIADLEGYELISEKTIQIAFIDGEIVVEVYYKKIPERTPNTADIEGVNRLLAIGIMSVIVGGVILARKYVIKRYSK